MVMVLFLFLWKQTCGFKGEFWARCSNWLCCKLFRNFACQWLEYHRSVESKHNFQIDVDHVVICWGILLVSDSNTISLPVAESGRWICGRSSSTSCSTSLTATTSRTWGPCGGSLRTTSWPTWLLTSTRWWPGCRPACGPRPSNSPRGRRLLLGHTAWGQSYAPEAV